MARIPLRGHGCQNKKSLVHSLGDGRGDRPRSTLHMSWPVLRSTLTASSSRRWPHSPATHVAPSLRRYVNVGAGGGETVKHTGGGQHKTGQSAATAWHTAAFCLQVTMLRFSHLDLTPASISPDAKACYEPVTATSPCGVSVVSPSHTQYRGRADGYRVQQSQIPSKSGQCGNCHQPPETCRACLGIKNGPRGELPLATVDAKGVPYTHKPSRSRLLIPRMHPCPLAWYSGILLLYTVPRKRPNGGAHPSRKIRRSSPPCRRQTQCPQSHPW